MTLQQDQAPRPLIDAPISPRDPPSRENCGHRPPPELVSAIEQFNRGEYWEQHETLERVWRDEPDASIRNLYKGIIQVGVGFYHLQQGNLPGAIKVLARGITYLRPYAPQCCGIDLARLLADASHVYWRVVETGQAGRDEWVDLPKVHYVEGERSGDE